MKSAKANAFQPKLGRASRFLGSSNESDKKDDSAASVADAQAKMPMGMQDAIAQMQKEIAELTAQREEDAKKLALQLELEKQQQAKLLEQALKSQQESIDMGKQEIQEQVKVLESQQKVAFKTIITSLISTNFEQCDLLANIQKLVGGKFDQEALKEMHEEIIEQHRILATEAGYHDIADEITKALEPSSGDSEAHADVAALGGVIEDASI